MASFKSSAGSVGFDPITTPDNARRIREEGEAKLRNLRDAYQQDIRNKQNYVSAVEAADAKTLQQIQNNQNLQRDFDRTYEEQLNKRYEQETEKARKEAAANITPLQRLSKFSQTALGLTKELVQKNKEDQQEFGQYLASEFNLSPDDLVALRQGEAELKAENTANNAVVERLKAAGATPDQIQAIRNLDGWRLYGAEISMAQSGGEKWNQFLNSKENRDKKVDLGNGQMMSLSEALEGGLGAEYRTIRAIHQAKFLKNYSRMGREFANEYLYPDIRKANDIDDGEFTTQNNKRLEQEETTFRQQETLGLAKSLQTDLSAVSELIQRRAGGNRELFGAKRAEFLEDVAYLAENGMLKGDVWDKIKGSLIEINGKKKTFYEQYKNHPDTGAAIADIDKKVFNLQRETWNREQGTKEIQAKQMDQDFVERVAQGEMSVEEITEWTTERKTMYPGVPISLSARDRINNSGASNMERVAQENLAEEMLLDGTLTRDKLNSHRFKDISQDKKQALLATLESSPADGFKDTDFNAKATVKAALKQSLGFTLSDEVSVEVEQMLPKAMNHLRGKIRKMNASGTPYQQAIENAIQETVKEINEGNSNGLFERRKAAGSESLYEGFVHNSKIPEEIRQKQFKSIVDAMVEDPQLFKNQSVFGDIDDANSFLYEAHNVIRNNQTPPPWLKSMADATPGMTWKDILNSQLIMNDLPPIPYARDEIVPQVVAPEVRSLTTDQPNTGTVSRALRYTAQKNGEQGPAIYKPMLDLMASKESSNDTVHGGYDALNVGGTHGGHRPIGSNTGENKFGKPLIKMTYGEIRNLQKSGALHAVGRYQFIDQTLEDMEKRGLIDPRITDDTPFNEEVQDRIAIAYLNDTIGAYRGSDGSIIYGLGQRWIGLQKVNRAEIQRALDIIQGDIRLQAFVGVDVKPEFIQSGGFQRALAHTQGTKE